MITIDAADKAGNAMETYQDTVAVALIPQPADPENYSVSVIPDTQGNAYSSMIFPRLPPLRASWSSIWAILWTA